MMNRKTIKMNRKTKNRRKSRKNYSGGQSLKLQHVNCSPKEKNEMNDFTCYNNKALYKLRDLWNARHPDVLIKTNDTKEIHKLLTRNMSNVCKKESCWIKQVSGVLESDLTDSFAPESPSDWKKNPKEWLTSVDINKVMKQYEKAYKCFDFIGPSPIDFDTRLMYGECVWEELCNFNLAEQIKKGKTKIGIIFNTDPHYKPGEHWLSMFINIKKGLIYFFDSVGNKIPEKIKKLVNRIQKQGSELSPPIDFKFDQNYPVEHQYTTSECGVYSLYFIVHMLEDKLTEEYLKTHKLKDEYITKFRKVYFNDSL